MIYAVDAHVLIWCLEGDPKLPAVVESILDDPASELVVPTIVLAEVWHRHQRGKIQTSLTDVRTLIDALSNAVITAFDEASLSLLPAGLEIHDAIVVATARLLGTGGTSPVRVVTRDRQIAASGLVDVVW